MVGQRLGHFEIIKELGRGGMGVVYEARDTYLNRRCALKVLLPEITDVETLQRFDREAKSLALSRHPGIVRVFTYGKIGQINYIAMELVPGGSLKNTLSKTDKVDFVLGLNWLIQIASALSVIHQNNIIHRDLKPENVLIRGEQLCISDFGLAKQVSGQDQLTATGMVLGTPSFMAPEQIDRSAGDLSPATDIFAFGVIAYRIFSGQNPFVGSTIQELFAAILSEKRQHLGSYEATVDIPEALIQLIEACLATDPRDRPANAGELLQELERVEGQVGQVEEVDCGISWGYGVLVPTVLICILGLYILSRWTTPLVTHKQERLHAEREQQKFLKTQLSIARRLRDQYLPVQAELQERVRRRKLKSWSVVDQIELIHRVEDKLPDLKILKLLKNSDLVRRLLQQRLAFSRVAASYNFTQTTSILAMSRVTAFCNQPGFEALWRDKSARSIRLKMQLLRILNFLRYPKLSDRSLEAKALEVILDEERLRAKSEQVDSVLIDLGEQCLTLIQYQFDLPKLDVNAQNAEFQRLLQRSLKSLARYRYRCEESDIQIAIVGVLYFRHLSRLVDLMATQEQSGLIDLMEPRRIQEKFLDLQLQSAQLNAAIERDFRARVLNRIACDSELRRKALEYLKVEDAGWTIFERDWFDGLYNVACHSFSQSGKLEIMAFAMKALLTNIQQVRRLKNWNDAHFTLWLVIEDYLSIYTILDGRDFVMIGALSESYFSRMADLTGNRISLSFARQHRLAVSRVVKALSGRDSSTNLAALRASDKQYTAQMTQFILFILLYHRNFFESVDFQAQPAEFDASLDFTFEQCLQNLNKQLINTRFSALWIAYDVIVLRLLFRQARFIVRALVRDSSKIQNAVGEKRTLEVRRYGTSIVNRATLLKRLFHLIEERIEVYKADYKKEPRQFIRWAKLIRTSSQDVERFIRFYLSPKPR